MPDGQTQTKLRSFAVLVIAVGKDGVALIKDPSRETDAVHAEWKFPGGKAKVHEMELAQTNLLGATQAAAARELEEETGIIVDADRFELLNSEAKRRRDRYSGAVIGEYDVHFLGVKLELELPMYAHHYTLGQAATGEVTDVVLLDELPDAIAAVRPHRKLLDLPKVRAFLASCRQTA